MIIRLLANSSIQGVKYLCNMDKFSKAERSEIMSRIRGRDSKIELLFRKELWKRGLRYRKNPSKYFGKPDVVLKKHKTVIFIDSCFWHGCKKHGSIPVVRRSFWTEKITRNVKRDREVSRHYKKQGWKVFRISEHEIKADVVRATGKVLRVL